MGGVDFGKLHIDRQIAVFLECPTQTDRTPRGFGLLPPPVKVVGRKENSFPTDARESHGPVTLFRRVGNAVSRHAVPAAEASRLLGRALDDARQAHATLFNQLYFLAQLRELLGIELSAEVPEPDDKRRRLAPQFRQAPAFTLECDIR